MSLRYVSVFYSFFKREASGRAVTLDDATLIFWIQEELTDYPPFRIKDLLKSFISESYIHSLKYPLPDR